MCVPGASAVPLFVYRRSFVAESDTHHPSVPEHYPPSTGEFLNPRPISCLPFFRRYAVYRCRLAVVCHITPLKATTRRARWSLGESMEHQPTIEDGRRGGNARVRGHQSLARGGDAGERVIGPGGPGGDADVEGNNSKGYGGPGGRGGAYAGGAGGSVTVRGDNKFYAGGEGGEARQPDGRGGRGGRMGYFALRPADRPVLPYAESLLAGFGRGGDAGHSPQYAARLMVIEDILGDRVTMHAVSGDLTDADTCSIVLARINQQLARDHHAWRVWIVAGCFEFHDV